MQAIDLRNALKRKRFLKQFNFAALIRTKAVKVEKKGPFVFVRLDERHPAARNICRLARRLVPLCNLDLPRKGIAKTPRSSEPPYTTVPIALFGRPARARLLLTIAAASMNVASATRLNATKHPETIWYSAKSLEKWGLIRMDYRYEPNRILRPLSLNPEFVAYKELKALLKQFVTELHPRFSVLAKHADFPQTPVRRSRSL